jgi:hypothetical protein
VLVLVLQLVLLL